MVGEAANGEQACAVVARLDPDVVLMDIRMPVLDGLAATRRLVAPGARCRVLVLTTFDLDEYVFAALRAGASGFLLKDAPAERAGRSRSGWSPRATSLLDPAVTRRVIDAFVDRGAGARGADRPALARLTPREREVLGLLARGLTNTQIARGSSSPRRRPRPT